MSYTWITADFHLGETRMNLIQRPFAGPAEMCEALLANYNKVVSVEDRVIFNGDIVFKSSPQREMWLEAIGKFHGRKTLVRGNHDEIFTDDQLTPYFETIIPEGQGIELEVDGIPVYVTHYPTLAREDRFNLVGHVHSSWKLQLNSLNVGVDVHHFRPMPLTDVQFYLEAISGFYDQDVWTAYLPANEKFKGLRGKSGSYFPPKDGVSRGGAGPMGAY